MSKAVAAVPPPPDDVLELLRGLASDAKDAQASFQKKLTQGALADPAVLAGEVGEMFSILADVSLYAFRAHSDHFEWGAEIDTELEEIKENLGEGGSMLLPEDAQRLKDTVIALAAALQSKTPLSAEALADLEKRAVTAVAFINEVTAEEVDEEDEDDEPAN